MLDRVTNTLELVKFSHTIFALPFALGAMWVAASGWPGWRIFLLILAAMITARSLAMAFNRLADERWDALNPRTTSRPLTSGKLSRGYVIGFSLVMAALFLWTASAINPLALQLAPFALVVLCGYSYTKRFTNWAHLCIGLALGLVPLAAEVAVLGQITLPFVVLGGAVTCWVAGFDILYALLDIDFDHEHKLHSIPVRYGIAKALWISRALHLVSSLGFIAFGWLTGGGPIYFTGAGLMALALIIEQALVKHDDLSKVNAAFFTANGWVSCIFLFAAMFGI
jgi:4-hydroxybenzoate polyprenyltransferase